MTGRLLPSLFSGNYGPLDKSVKFFGHLRKLTTENCQIGDFTIGYESREAENRQPWPTLSYADQTPVGESENGHQFWDIGTSDEVR